MAVAMFQIIINQQADKEEERSGRDFYASRTSFPQPRYATSMSVHPKTGWQNRAAKGITCVALVPFKSADQPDWVIY
jgi:hypothetical protein